MGFQKMENASGFPNSRQAEASAELPQAFPERPLRDPSLPPGQCWLFQRILDEVPCPRREG